MPHQLRLLVDCAPARANLITLHPAVVAQLKGATASKAATTEEVTMRISSSISPSPFIILPFSSDASVPRDSVIVHITTARRMKWRVGMEMDCGIVKEGEGGEDEQKNSRAVAAVAPSSPPPPPQSAFSPSDCFPQEWKSLNQFIQNAVLAYVSTSSAATFASAASSSTATVGPSAHPSFGLSIPRALLMSGSSGSGKTTLINALSSTLLSNSTAASTSHAAAQLQHRHPPQSFVLRRISGTELLTKTPANANMSDTTRDHRGGGGGVIMQYYNELHRHLMARSTEEEKEEEKKGIEHRASSTRKIGLLIMEDIDAIICSSTHSHLAVEMMSLLDRLASASAASSSTTSPSPLILLLCTISSPLSSVPSHFLTSGRFEMKVRVQMLTGEQRQKIVENQLEKVMGESKEMKDEEKSSSPASSTSHPLLQQPLRSLCQRLSEITPGYVAADLARLVQYSLLHAARRWDSLLTDTQVQQQQQHQIEWCDFEAGLKRTHLSSRAGEKMQFKDTTTNTSPTIATSSLSSTLSSSSPSSFPTIGGYTLLKQRLALTLHHWLHPSSISALGLRPISGILFHGPSGCGKTLFANSIAQHAGLNFISVSVADVYSMYLGESERKIRSYFQRAGDLAPCVLLLDQIDAIAGKRRDDTAAGDASDANSVDKRILSTLLNEMDGISKRQGVYVVGCTSRLDALDSALQRPGRFDDLIEVDRPNEADRLEILRVHTKQVRLHENVRMEEIAHKTQGMTGADLIQMLSQAGMNALRANLDQNVIRVRVQQEHLLEALRN